ncbi:MAG: helix-turn-helix domain-containing protein [Solirubrobacteraceae bacterium]
MTGSATAASLWAPPPPVSDRPPTPVVEPTDGLVREPWVTKRELAAHLHVALRWIEAQHHHGLPHARRGGVLRYRISEVEAWLRGEPATEGGS